MPNPYFVLFELMIYLLFALSIQHARQQGLTNLLRLMAGFFYGIILELATLRQLIAYEYGQFLLKIGDAPFGFVARVLRAHG